MDLNASYDRPSSSKAARQETRNFEEVGAQAGIASTAELVDAYNQATDDAERCRLRRWLENYVRWFYKQCEFDLTESVINAYTKLASVQFRTQEDGLLVKGFLFSLISSLKELSPCTYNIIAALEYVLNVMDPKLLDDNITELLELVWLLLSHLDPSKRPFTKKLFVENAVTLFALHQTLVVIETVAPDQLTKSILKKLKNTVRKIEESDAYYPYVYYGRLVKHSIKNLKKHNGLGSWVSTSRRVINGLYGSLCLLQGLRAIAQLDYDFAAVESAFVYFKKAFGNIDRDKWTKQLQALGDAAKTSIERDDFNHFKAQWLASINEGMRRWKEKNGKMMRYCIISQLRMIAVEGGSVEIRNEAMDSLMDIAIDGSTDSWLQEPDLFEAMLDALHAIHMKGKHSMKPASGIMKLTTVTEDKKLKEIIDAWIGRGNRIQDVLERREPKVHDVQDELFNKIKNDVDLDLTSNPCVAVVRQSQGMSDRAGETSRSGCVDVDSSLPQN